MGEELYELKHYKKDSIVILQDSKAEPFFYIIQEGELSCSMDLNNKIINFEYKNGDTFGLIACLTNHNYIEKITAVSDCSLIVIKKENLISFLLNKKEIFLKIICNYSDRLRELDKILIKLCSEYIYFEDVNRLIDIAEYYEKQNNKKNMVYALNKYIETSNDENKNKKIKTKLKSIQEIFETKKIINSKLSIKKGEIIFLEHEKGNNFFFIEKGKVKISHITREKEIIIAILKEKEFFGEMAILNHTTRMASAIAFEDCELLVLDKNNFFDKLEDSILKNVFISFAKRIWFIYRKLLNLSYDNPLTRLYDYLEILILSNEGRIAYNQYYFDVSIEELKKATNTTNVNDDEIKDIFNDHNIVFNYGTIKINNKNIFLSNLNKYLSKEKLFHKL